MRTLRKKLAAFAVLFCVLLFASTPAVYAEEISDLEKSVDSLYDSLSDEAKKDLRSISSLRLDVFVSAICSLSKAKRYIF